MRVGGSGGCGRGVSALPLTPTPPQPPLHPTLLPPSHLPSFRSSLALSVTLRTRPHAAPHRPNLGTNSHVEEDGWFPLAPRHLLYLSVCEMICAPAASIPRSPDLFVSVKLEFNTCASKIYARLHCMFACTVYFPPEPGSTLCYETQKV